MNDSLKLLLEQVYELEGLLHVVDNHGSETDKYVFELIHKKADAIAEMSKLVTCENFAPSVTDHIQDSELIKPTETSGPTPLTVDQDEDKIGETENDVDNLSHKETEVKPNSEQIDDDIVDDEEYDSENGFEIDEDDVEEGSEEDDETLTVDEVLRRKRSSDLHKAFSLNDRFRYRRELFANNDVEMNDTLNLVETMQSFAEAEEFFYGDLEWDRESPEVVDFMEVIKNYFYNRK